MEKFNKFVYSLYKMVQESDSNDWMNYINLIEANKNIVAPILSSQWRISNSLNYKTVYFQKMHFEFGEKMKAYVFDGNGAKRYIVEINCGYKKIEYPSNSREENINYASKRMRELLELLPKSDLVLTKLLKSDLEDYSEKSYKVKGIYLAKSQVGFDGENVVLPMWLAKKYGF